VFSERVADTSLREFAVVRHDDRLFLLRVNRQLVVIRRDATGEVRLGCRPTLSQAARSTRPTATSTSLSSRNRTRHAKHARVSRGRVGSTSAAQSTDSDGTRSTHGGHLRARDACFCSV
jgi:hypothetical protein